MSQTDAKKIWRDILSVLEKDISAVAYDVWIRPLEPVCVHDADGLILMAQTVSAKNTVTNRYSEFITKALRSLELYVTNVSVIAPEEKDKYTASISTYSPSAPYEYPAVPLSSIEFNKNYTFDSFVVGKSNHLASAAAHAVAEAPAAKFNPLFIYGGVGLGKTHLMHAIGNYLRHERTDLKVMYVTCDRFTNELIASIRAGKAQNNQDFRDKYRNVDVLMIDDIQFIAGKTGTQEEFFHTFNDLQQAGKQIILSSDRPPKDIERLEERLRTRFEWGMTADIQPPDLELRIAILQRKAFEEKFSVSNEVLTMIAEKVRDNIREMEGLLKRVVFYASLTDKSAKDTSLAAEALREYADDKKEAVDADIIIAAVCRHFNVDKVSLLGKKKTKEIVDPRQIAIYLTTEFLPDMPLSAIGQIFGGRDHTTVMHSRDKIAAAAKEGGRVAAQIKDIRNIILKI